MMQQTTATKFWASLVTGAFGLASVFGLHVDPTLGVLLTSIGQAAVTYLAPNQPIQPNQ